MNVKDPPDRSTLPTQQGRHTPLFTHLFVSHTMPVLVIVGALSLSLIALVRISLVLTDLRDTHLTALHSEGELHRAAWDVDVSMRRGQADCVAEQSVDAVRNRIARKLGVLAVEIAESRQLESSTPSSMLPLAVQYASAAREVLAAEPCEVLLGVDMGRRRAQLDEEITSLWVARLQELHQAVADIDNDARSIAVQATWTGIPVAIISFLLAMYIARRMTRLVTLPLAKLASIATRVGQGDFKTTGSGVRNGPQEVVGLARELERMRQQLQQLENLKQGFLASVSHELRTPLSKIREALALMQDGAVGDFTSKQARLIQIARTACEREIRMVTILLDLSRLRAGGAIHSREGVSVDAVLQAAVHDEQDDAAGRQVAVQLRTAGAVPLARIDPVLLERAVANLIRNASSVSPPDSCVLVQRFAVSERPHHAGQWIRITVADTGPGVPPEIRDTIFDAFVTHAIPRSGKAVGVGLGLALAREVAQAHGGHLELADTGTSGTTFQLWLPLGASAKNNAKVTAQNTATLLPSESFKAS